MFSFATIGFGDYVPTVAPQHLNPVVYGVANFLLLALGASCVYSMFNVSSIVVRQLLNWIIKKMDIKIQRRKKRYVGLGLRPPKGNRLMIILEYDGR
jgi:hypothetical protein